MTPRTIVLDANMLMRFVLGRRFSELLNCPIWTENCDFFGTGVATWTTAVAALYFTESGSEPPEH